MENLSLFKNKKKLAEEKLQKLQNEKDPKAIIILYNDLLNIDNTNKDIILKYLLHVKHIYGDDFKKDRYIDEELNTFLYHIPVEIWNNNFAEVFEKKYSSLEKLEQIFEKILSNDWAMAEIKNKKEVLEFFRDNIHYMIRDIKNTSPITWENEELYVYYLYKEFLGRIEKKILYYADKNKFKYTQNKDYLLSNKIIQNLESNLNDDLSEPLRKGLNNLITQAYNRRESIIICVGDFFLKYLDNFREFLLTINNTYLKDFSKKKFDKKEDRELFERFMLFISNYEFENIPNLILDVWKNSFETLSTAEKIKILEGYKGTYSPFYLEFDNKNTIKITPKKKGKPFIIDNVDDYDLNNLMMDISLKVKFDENECIKYVKIPKIDRHLYIKQIANEWIDFNITIFNSKAIISIFKNLFVNQDYSLLDKNELKILIENIIYFTFEADFKGMTSRTTMKIYEYGPLIPLENKDVSKLISLAFLININEHEILGHYNIGYQIYKGKDKKIIKSPKIEKQLASDYAKDNECIESGENIEIQLYGRVIEYLTLKEALFIMNPDNYNEDSEQFRTNFMNCNQKEIKIDKKFSDFLKKFGIDSTNIPTDINEIFSIAKFIKKFTERNIFTIKGKHPIGYHADGLKIDHSKVIAKLNNIINLDFNTIKPINEDFMKLLEKNLDKNISLDMFNSK